MSTPQETYETLCRFHRETAMLGAIDSLLNWDERTQLPPAAGEFRAEQITYLTGMIHQRSVDPRIGDWLEELAASPLAEDPHSDTGCTIPPAPAHLRERETITARACRGVGPYLGSGPAEVGPGPSR